MACDKTYSNLYRKYCKLKAENETLCAAIATPEVYAGVITRVVEAERDAAVGRVRVLEATIGKFPKTADGVTIVPGMQVWHDYWAGPYLETVKGFGIEMEPETIWADDEADAACLHSTKESAVAAIAAKAKENDRLPRVRRVVKTYYSTRAAAAAAKKGTT